jgi:FtsZ-interacting cell division protein ZipA
VETWQIILIVVAVLVVLALLALMFARRSKAGAHRKREQAREHMQEAQVRAARADRETALAEEQAARARRERAEVEERAAVAEREARERAEHAEHDRSAAQELRAKAEKLAPDVTADHNRPGDTHTERVEQTQVVREQPGVPPQRDVVREEVVREDDPAYRDGYGGDGATRR